MIKSMTGFGRSEISEGKRKISVEMKSVNHRYLEAGIKMPKKLNIFEARIRDLLKKYAQRGKIDIFITYEDLSETNVNLKYNRDIAAEYMDIFEVKVDEEELWHFIEKAVCAACEQFVAARITEGEHLKKDLLDKLDNMAGLVDFIEARSPQIMKEYRGKLEQKVTELLGENPFDENKMAAEVILYADKICVDEETVRLRSHIDHAKSCLNEDGGIGRKLDFIAQEMNREANTILSKANDLEISNKAIDLKTEIEKVREQIQNIE